MTPKELTINVLMKEGSNYFIFQFGDETNNLFPRFIYIFKLKFSYQSQIQTFPNWPYFRSGKKVLSGLRIEPWYFHSTFWIDELDPGIWSRSYWRAWVRRWRLLLSTYPAFHLASTACFVAHSRKSVWAARWFWRNS